MKTLGHQTKTTEASLTNRLQDIEERILGFEDKVQEMNT